MITLYVDDLHIARYTLECIHLLKKQMYTLESVTFSKRFGMADCGEVQNCLGSEIARCRSEHLLKFKEGRLFQNRT